MHEQFDTLGGTTPSDTELAQRIRAAARAGSRATADPYGAPAPDGAAETGEEALDEFHRRHYAAVLAYARSCSRTSQAAADLAKEAIDRVLHSQEPGEGADAVSPNAAQTPRIPGASPPSPLGCSQLERVARAKRAQPSVAGECRGGSLSIRATSALKAN